MHVVIKSKKSGHSQVVNSHKIKEKWSFTSGQSGIVFPGVNVFFKCTWKAQTYPICKLKRVRYMRYYNLMHINQKKNRQF